MNEVMRLAWVAINQENDFSNCSMSVLGMASGVYLPLIYAIVCKGFKRHQQGLLCGAIDATGTLAEILSPLFASVIISINIPVNFSFAIISLGFLFSFIIVKAHHFVRGARSEKNH